MKKIYKTQAIVTDIEGTTSSLSFVKEVLFPYARRHMADFVRDQAHAPEVAVLLDEVRAEMAADADLNSIIQQLEQWIDEDKKITPLKALQGLLWERGYQQGDFTGHVYADAKQQLARWHEQGLALYVYSSGSVYAQRLLFSHSDYGDLTPLFTGYFDTKTGAKVERLSYQRIAEAVDLSAKDMVFLSDIEAELDAARAAGMQTIWLVREGPVTRQAAHAQVRCFDEIDVELGYN